MLGWVAAVSATESPSQLSPALIQRTWTTVSSGGASVDAVTDPPRVLENAAAAPESGLRPTGRDVNRCLSHPPSRPRSRRVQRREVVPSADPREGVADQHVDDAGAAEPGDEHDEPGRFGAHLADDGRVAYRADGPESRRARRLPRRAARSATNLPSLATYSGSMPSSSHAPATAGRMGRRSSSSTTVRFVSRASSLHTVPTPPRVASRNHRVRGAAPSSTSTSSVQWCGVGGDVGFEREITAREHHRDPVVGRRARDDHDVAGLDGDRREHTPPGHEPDTGRRDVHAVGRASVDDLRVAGDDRRLRPRPRRSAMSATISRNCVDREALLEHEPGRQCERPRAHHRQIVDRAVDREVADRRVRELQRLHDIGVGGERDRLAGRECEQRRIGLRARAGRRCFATNAGRKTASSSAAEALPPAPCASVTTSSSSRGRRRRKASMRSSTAASRRRGASGSVVMTRRFARARRCTADHSVEQQRLLRLLDPVDAVGAHDQTMLHVAAARHRAAVVTTTAPPSAARAARLGERAQHVLRAAARREPDRDVAGPGVRDQLAREHELETDIVGERGQYRLSSTSDSAGSGVPAGGMSEQRPRASASVALPPLPNVNSRPPCRKRCSHRRAGGRDRAARTRRASPPAKPRSRRSWPVADAAEIGEQRAGVALVRSMNGYRKPVVRSSDVTGAPSEHRPGERDAGVDEHEIAGPDRRRRG